MNTYSQIEKLKNLYPEFKFDVLVLEPEEVRKLKSKRELPLLMAHKSKNIFVMVTDGFNVNHELDELVDFMEDYDCRKLINDQEATTLC